MSSAGGRSPYESGLSGFMLYGQGGSDVVRAEPVSLSVIKGRLSAFWNPYLGSAPEWCPSVPVLKFASVTASLQVGSSVPGQIYPFLHANG